MMKRSKAALAGRKWLPPPERGPCLPDARALAILLVLHCVLNVQNVVCNQIGDVSVHRWQTGFVWGVICLAGFGLVFVGRCVLAGLVRRGRVLLRPRWSSWGSFYGIFFAFSLAGALLRIPLGWAFCPAIYQTGPEGALVAVGTCMGLLYVTLCEIMTATLTSLVARREARQHLATALTQARTDMVLTDDVQRREVAEVLHGKFQTVLVVASAHVAAARAAGPDTAVQADHLARAVQLVEALQAEFGVSLWESLTVSDESLREPIAAVVARFRQICPVALEVDAAAAGQPLAGQLGPAAIHMLKEALLNAHRHAGATQIWVGLERPDAGRLVLTVRDNGRGFDMTSPSRGLGLTGLGARLVELSGSWQIDSAPGRGTTVTLQLPVKGPA